jgi:hypothetical protein
LRSFDTPTPSGESDSSPHADTFDPPEPTL